MAIILNGDTGITGVPAIGSAAADTPVILGDSGTNYNTCRAWVNFNGTSTVAIRADFNVTSITDNGTGDYTVNFTTAMPDANYSAISTAQRNNAGGASWTGLYGGTSLVQTTTTARFLNLTGAGALEDPQALCVAIFR